MTERTRIARPRIQPALRARSGRTLWLGLIGVILTVTCLPTAGLAQGGYWAHLANHQAPPPPAQETAAAPPVRRLPPVTEGFSAWWDEAIHHPLLTNAVAHPATLESLIISALQCSSRVTVIKDIPLITRTSIVEAEANFDWTAFIDTKWNDIDEPVGDFAIGGGQTRLIEEDADYRMGVRRRNIHGGRFEIAQELGWEDSNSNFFIPKNQGLAQLTASYRQPLLQGGGVQYNTAPIVLAQLDTDIAQDELTKRLQEYIVQLVRAYWEMYLERGRVLQQRRALERANDILKQLTPRIDIDAPLSQIARTQAAVATRRAGLIRAETAARDAQSQIRALVSDPTIRDPLPIELVTLDMPSPHWLQLDFSQAVQTALRLRPEMDQALKKIRATATKLDVSKNELLPVLDLVLEMYVQGLRGQADIGEAYTDQFVAGSPSYTVGLQFEVPIHFRAARARFERRQLELRQVTNEMNVTAENLIAEVDQVVRNVGASYQEMEANHTAMQAAERELKFIHRRWTQVTSDDRLGSVVLSDLLDALDRSTLAEFRFLRSQVNYNLALVNLEKATGMLLHSERISYAEACACGLPQIILDKPRLQHAAPLRHQAAAPHHYPR